MGRCWVSTYATYVLVCLARPATGVASAAPCGSAAPVGPTHTGPLAACRCQGQSCCSFWGCLPQRWVIKMSLNTENYSRGQMPSASALPCPYHHHDTHHHHGTQCHNQYPSCRTQ
ncbi:hypothetical protein V8C86DRAFT_1252017 [Haematococcus lacustris]